MANFKCIKCSASYEDEIVGILYCPYCGQLQPLPPNLTDEQTELIYNEALTVADRAKNIENLEDVVQVFEQLGAYKDSKHQAERCKRKVTELKNEEIYSRALACMEKESIRGYREAIELFSQITQWRNSSFKIDEANAKLATLLEKWEKRKQLIFKITMIACACLIAAGILTYLIIELVVPAIRYSSAKNHLEDKEYDQAYEILEDLGTYKDSATLIKQSKYERAVEALASGDRSNAIRLFGGAKGYRDAEKKQLELCMSNAFTVKDQVELLEVGNTVIFGKYDQDPTQEGKELMEWVILQKDANKALLISKEAIDASPYGVTGSKWSKSALRNWLNGSFVESTFANEKGFLKYEFTTTIYKDAEGNDVPDASNDRVFILGENEVSKYFSSDLERCTRATEYLKAKGIYVNPDNGAVHYWLRNAALDGKIKYVNGGGAINQDGALPTEINAIRPAVWIGLE